MNCPIALVAVASSTLVGLSLQASLIQATDAGFGPNALTVDTSTGLEWLDLGASSGLSYEQVLADTQPGGVFSGFRFATAQEVFQLYASAGIPGPGDYALSSPAISFLFTLVGPSGSINGLPGMLGLSATPGSGGQYAPAIYVTGINGSSEYWVNSATLYGDATAYPELSSWLVKDVPEHTDATIYGLAAAGLFGCGWLLRRPNTA
jgi:hypothetical protein